VVYSFLFIKEIPENGADLAHLHHLHKPFILAGVDLRRIYNPIFSMFTHKWVAQWEPLPEPQQHIGQLSLIHAIQLWGYTVPFTTIKVEVHQVRILCVLLPTVFVISTSQTCTSLLTNLTKSTLFTCLHKQCDTY